MAGHLALSLPIILLTAVATGATAYIAHRDLGRARNHLIAAPLLAAFIVVIAVSASATAPRRCPDSNDFCSYDDAAGPIATFVAIYVVAGAAKIWFLLSDR